MFRTSEPSEAVRLENRADGTLGRALVFGTEWIAADGESRAMAWDSMQVPDGWRKNGTLVRNDSSISIEGGRLAESATWTPGITRLLRNWVIVPKNVTLRIEAGTVVKFCEKTGFKVEAGGKIVVAGTEESPVVYTAAADDTIGGDSDLRDAVPNDGDYGVNILSGGTYSDSNCAVRYTAFSNLGTASVPAKVIGTIPDRIVRIPVFISTDRTTKFCVDWRVVERGSSPDPVAVVTNLSGRVTWSGKNDGTRYIVLPVVPEALPDGFASFEIELYESQGINISTTARRCAVTVYADSRFPAVASAVSEASEAVRLENRDWEWSYGAPVVCGTEWKSADGDARAEAWDTTREKDGWLDLGGTEVLVRNDPAISVEGGRLASNATWTPDVTHLVRNWVVVPNGVTLTVTAGTVVKFCDATGIKVEAGGRLVSAGTAASDVIFTSVNDDTAGGDTDLVDEEPLTGEYRITVLSGGTFADTCTQMRYGTSGTFGTASVPTRVVAKKDGGVARIPVAVNTSRTTPFAVDWVAYDNGATAGEDYLLASGRIEWTSGSQGTKFLEIPLDRMSETSANEGFAIELVTGLGINLNPASTFCEVSLYDTREEAPVGTNVGHAASGWCDFAALDSTAGTGPIFAMDEIPVRYSTRWAGDASSTARVTATDAEKNLMVLHEAVSPDEGEVLWNGADYEDGRYDLAHRILDGNGRTVKVDAATFIVNRDVVRHAGRLADDEIWAADRVHLVVSTVTVPSGVTLTIAPDAIVKFMPGASIVVEKGGLGICKGAILTHAYDDVMGGDTFFDGAETVPEDGGYSLSGDWEDDESTQYRYSMPLEVSGTLRGENRWPGHKTYVVTGNLSLASGATLTIEAGAVVKFKSGLSFTVNSGATLNAQGTRSSPVVFTSFKDDIHGGDTNGDGDKTYAQAGDWARIYAGGTLNMNYCLIRHCNNNSDQGAIQGTGGTVTFDNGIIESSVYECVRMNSGRFTAHNSMFRDSSMGFGYYGGSGVYLYNCIVSDCTIGCRASNKHFYNTVFYRCQTFLESTSSSCDHCLFFNPAGYGAQSATQVGSNGNVWGDPCFVDPGNGDFRIASGSPCIDAGDGMVAPERDYYGQTRQTLCGDAIGTPATNGGIPDIGLFEVQPRNASSDIDLAAVSVAVSEEAVVIGGKLTVSWTVENLGSATVPTPWRDAVELIAANGAVVSLGEMTTDSLAAGGRRVVSAAFAVPSMELGAARIRVKVNPYRDIYEGTQTDNNVALAETTVVVQLPDYEVPPASGLSLPSGGSVAYRVPAGSGTAAFRIRGTGAVAAYASSGAIPTSLLNDAASATLSDGTALLVLPKDADGTDYNVSFVNEDAFAVRIQVTPLDSALSILETAPARLANTGTGHLTLLGIGMDRVAEVRLEGGRTVAATEFLVSSPAQLAATFDLAGVPVGNYAVILVDGDGATHRFDATIELYKPTMGPKLEVWLEMPSSVRQGRGYTVRVNYRNVGDEDMAAPCFQLQAANAKLKTKNGEIAGDALVFLGIGGRAPHGILKAGEENRQDFMFVSGRQPRLTLARLAGGGNGWSRDQAALSAAATALNSRGRTVVLLEDLAEYCVREWNRQDNAAIFGRIDMAGADSAGVLVVAETAAGEVVATDEADNEGRYVLGGLANGTNYVVRIESGGEAAVAVVEVPESGDAALDIAAVVERKARATVTGIPAGEGTNGVVRLLSGTGDELGRTALAGTEVEIGYVSDNPVDVLHFEAELESGRRATGIGVASPYDAQGELKAEIDFSESWLLGGRMLAADGSPLEGGRVVLRNEDWTTVASAETGADGEYRFGGLEEGRYLLEAEAAGVRSGAVSVDFAGNGDVRRDFSMPEPEAGSLGMEMPAEASGMRLVIESTAGAASCAFQTTEGNLLVEGVPSGEYEIYLTDTNGCLASAVAKAVVGNSRTNIRLEKVEAVSMEARLVDAAGAAVQGAVTVEGAKGCARMFAADETGLVRMDAPAGGAWFTAEAPGCEPRGFYAECAQGASWTVTLTADTYVEEEYPAEDEETGGETVELAGTLTGSGIYGIEFLSADRKSLAQAEVCGPSGSYRLAEVPAEYEFIWLTDESGLGILRSRAEFEADGGLLDPEATNAGDLEVSVYADAKRSIPLPNVLVTVEGEESNRVTRTTGADGVARFRLSAGEYAIVAERAYVGGGGETTVCVTAGGASAKSCVLESATGAEGGWLRAKARAGKAASPSRKGGQAATHAIDWNGVRQFGRNVVTEANCLIPQQIAGEITYLAGIAGIYAARASGMYREEPTLWCEHNANIWREYRVAHLRFDGLVSDARYDAELMMRAYGNFSIMALYKLAGYHPVIGITSSLTELIADASQGRDVRAQQGRYVSDQVGQIGDQLNDQADDWTEQISQLQNEQARNSQRVNDLKKQRSGIDRQLSKTQTKGVARLNLIHQRQAVESEIARLVARNKAIPGLVKNLQRNLGRFAKIARGSTKYSKVIGTAGTVISIAADLVDLYNYAVEVERYRSCLRADAQAIGCAFARLERAWRNPYHTHETLCDGVDTDSVCLAGVVEITETNRMDRADAQTPVSSDPNEMAGPPGIGEERLVAPAQQMDYIIYFENKSDAETSAQEIRVTAQLDPSLDWSTFQWGAVSFGNQIDNGLAKESTKRHVSSEVKQGGTDYYVVTDATFNETTGQVTWYLRICDKTTADDWPTDLHAGILPPNDPETHIGEGYIAYSVNVRRDASPGTKVDASATIVFDYNDPIPTDPAWWNTVGAVAEAMPVYRFYSKNYKGHFFTIDEDEMWTIRNTNRNWSFEGTAYMAFTNQVDGTVPLYRFYSKGYRGHFFTIDADEAEVVKKNRNWEYEGVAYYVYPQEVDGSVPVFRFWSDRYRHHFYTINEEEKDSLIATNPNWAYEGVAFYALQAETADSGLRSLKKSVSSAAVAVAGEETRSEGHIPGNGSSVAAESEASLRTTVRVNALAASSGESGDEWCSDAEPWSLWTRNGTPIACDGSTELDAVVVESRLDAPDAEELQSAESAEGDALLAEKPPVELSLRLSGAPAMRNATLWSATDGTVSEESFDGTLDFDLPATGVWHWLRAADDSGNDSVSVWLRATAD